MGRPEKETAKDPPTFESLGFFQNCLHVTLQDRWRREEVDKSKSMIQVSAFDVMPSRLSFIMDNH